MLAPPAIPQTWVDSLTSARKRKGWTYQRLACEAELSPRTVTRALVYGRCTANSLLRLATALGIGIQLVPPQQPLSAQHAQFGR